MTTISDKFNRAFQSKEAIRQALISKGVEVSTDVPFADYAEKINNIESGSDNNPYQELYMQRTANETSIKGLFAYTPASSTLDLSNVNTSKVTDMSYMFSECKAPYLDLSSFDVSNVTNMSYMFQFCTSEINIDGWDTSKLTNASNMFYSFTNNNKYLDLSVLDFSNVTKADNMFDNCNVNNIDIRNLNLNLAKLSNLPFKSVKGAVLDLSKYDITGLKSTYQLCYFCGCPTVNLTNWKTTEVTDMRNTFYYCSSLEKIIMPDWDMTNVTKTSSFFYDCSKLNYIDLSRSNDATIAKIASLVPAKTLKAYGQILIPADSSQANIDALAAKYWKPIGPRIDMTSCEIAIELDEIKPGKTTKLCYGNKEPWYGNDASVEYVSSDESVATIDKETMTITSTGVEGTVEITARNIDTQEVISNTVSISVSETDNYPNVIKFRGTRTPTSGNYVTINGTNVMLSNMNYNSVSGIYTYDVGEPITRIRFNGKGVNWAETFTELIQFSARSLADSLSWMFSYTNIKEIDLSDWNFDRFEDGLYLEGMFSNCFKLESVIGFPDFVVTNKAADYMFQSCTSLKYLDLSRLNSIDAVRKIIKSSYFPTGTIPGVTRKIYCKQENAAGLTPPTNWEFVFVDEVPNAYVPGEFKGNYEITEVTTTVTKDNTDLNKMFYHCNNLTTINDMDTWDTSNVTDMSEMFYYCYDLTDVDFSSFNTSNVTDMEYMFACCESIKSLDLSSFDTSNVTNVDYMFFGCRSLETLDIRNFNLAKAEKNYDYAEQYCMDTFLNCDNLRVINMLNCDRDTIMKLTLYTGLPTELINNNKRKIYVSDISVVEGLSAPSGWEFKEI